MSGGISRRCKNCHKVFYDPIHKKAKKFCSRTCNCNYANRKYNTRMRESYKLLREVKMDPDVFINYTPNITVENLAKTIGIPESSLRGNVKVLKQMMEDIK